MSTLLQEIQVGSTTTKEPIADVLRRCLVLAARLNVPELAEWAEWELEGYSKGAAVPGYRCVQVPIHRGLVVNMTMKHKNAVLPLHNLPEEFRKFVDHAEFRQSICELEDLGRQKGEMQQPWPPPLLAMVNSQRLFYDNADVVSAGGLLIPSMFQGIVDAVRTRVLKFVLAIETRNPNAGELGGKGHSMTKQELSTVVNATIYGGNNNLATAGDATIGKSTASTTLGAPRIAEAAELAKQLRDEAEAIPDTADRAIAVTAATSLQHAIEATPFNVERAGKFLAIYSTVLTVVPPTVALLKRMLGLD